MEEGDLKSGSSTDVAKEGNADDMMLHCPSGDVPLLQGIRYNKGIRSKVIISICVCLAYGILGWTKGQLGPAFLDILHISGTDIENGSAFMTAYFIGRTIGPVLAGMLYAKMNKYLIFVFSMTLCSLIVVLIPWCIGYEQMITAHVFYGISGGILVVAVISEAVTIWGKTTRGKSFLQVLNTANAIFSVLSPLATAPFLLKTTEKEFELKDSLNATNDYYELQRLVVNSSILDNKIESFQNISSSVKYPESTSRLYIAYSISAAFVLLIALPFYILYCRSRNKTRSVRQTERVSYKLLGDHSLIAKRLQLVNVAIFVFVFFDLDFTFTSYLSAFCVLGINWEKSSGAFLTSVLFFASMFGRFFGIILVQILQVRTILLISSLIYTAGYIALLINGLAQNDFGVWISICVIGVPFGLSWPTFISWVNENLVPVYGKVPALFNAIGFFACIVNPLLIGYLMKELSPFCFIYLSVGKSVITVVNILLMFVYSSPTKPVFTSTKAMEECEKDRLEASSVNN